MSHNKWFASPKTFPRLDNIELRDGWFERLGLGKDRSAMRRYAELVDISPGVLHELYGASRAALELSELEHLSGNGDEMRTEPPSTRSPSGTTGRT